MDWGHTITKCAQRSTGNTPNIPQFIRRICSNQPIVWDIFEKCPHHISIVHVARDCSISRKECKTWPENETGLSFKRPFFTSFGEFIIGVDFVPHFWIYFIFLLSFFEQMNWKASAKLISKSVLERNLFWL